MASTRTLKVLLSSHAFFPSIGGIETVSALMAEEFCRLGHEVAVVTQTAAEADEKFSYSITRHPSTRELFGLVGWCDIFWQNNLSLRTLWPALCLGKPVVITHQGSYCRQPAGLDVLQRIKHALVNRQTSVAVSQFVASCFETRSIVIPNPYDARVFATRSGSERKGDLIFVGRIVSEKGLDILLESLVRLRSNALEPRLTVVGSGPELDATQHRARQLGLSPQVAFVGPKRSAEIAHILNHHKILVVPSRYNEPFGVVALEGIACGCVVVGSNGGGLPEAIGTCGITFPNGDSEALAKALETLLTQANERDQLTVNAPQHLARFQPAVIAQSYLNLFQSKLQ
jgi:glycogen(starch) synthase